MDEYLTHHLPIEYQNKDKKEQANFLFRHVPIIYVKNNKRHRYPSIISLIEQENIDNQNYFIERAT